MSNNKKAVDTSGLNRQQRQKQTNTPVELRNTVNQGTFGESRVEAVPNFIQTESEHVISNKNNSWIVLGRARPRGIASGYGGAGDTQAACIDLCVGRMSANPVSDAYVDPDFNNDAARIYISQKTDIDYNFTLAKGTVGESKTKSGIGIKADGIRIIGREGIKIVTSTDSSLSTGKKTKSIGNIDLIAGNDDDLLEPAVKGRQLVTLLEKIMKQISDVNNALCGFMTAQMGYNASIASHTHQCAGPWGAPTAFPSFELLTASSTIAINLGSKTGPSMAIAEMNKAGIKLNSLEPMGADYILSRNVNLT